jgi:hypothetical protein
VVCPYCQTNIKNSADVITCPSCKNVHHKECWEENKGCTTFGCKYNPNTQSKGIDIGDETIESLEKKLVDEKINEIPCPNCKSMIPEGSLFCNYCGYDLSNKINAKEEFEKEFRKRYKEKASFTKKRLIITTASIALIAILFFTSLFVTIYKLNNYFN